VKWWPAFLQSIWKTNACKKCNQNTRNAVLHFLHIKMAQAKKMAKKIQRHLCSVIAKLTLKF
jgi:hypothetical protein